MSPHTIIFDLGNVLIGWNPRNLYNNVFPTVEEADWFVRNVVTLDWNEEQDRGRPAAEATEILVGEFPQFDREIRMYYDRFEEQFSGAIPGTVELLKELDRRNEHRLLALTNWSAEFFPWARANFEFLKIFEDITVSGEIKMKKPEARIYEYIQKKYDLGNFAGCLFIDDSLRNVEAARKLGLDSIRFENPDQLRRALMQRGVL